MFSKERRTCWDFYAEEDGFLAQEAQENDTYGGSCCFYGAAHSADEGDGCARARCGGGFILSCGDKANVGGYQAGDNDDVSDGVLGCWCCTNAGTVDDGEGVFGCWCSTNAGTSQRSRRERNAMRPARKCGDGLKRIDDMWRHAEGAVLGRRCCTTTGIADPCGDGTVLGCWCFTNAGTEERRGAIEYAVRSAVDSSECIKRAVRSEADERRDEGFSPPMRNRCRRGGLSPTKGERGMLGRCLQDTTGIGGGRPLCMKRAARRLSFGHAGGPGYCIVSAGYRHAPNIARHIGRGISRGGLLPREEGGRPRLRGIKLRRAPEGPVLTRRWP